MTRGATILVVEDEPLSRTALVRLLGTRGFDVAEVRDAPSCMEWLEGRVPDLILLDVSMPGMSGLELLSWIRKRRSAEQLPVILVSALVESDDVIAGLEAGANDYVHKPINLPVLLARIRVCLGMKQSVERLVEAERHRVKLNALGETCRHLTGPMSATIGSLEQLVEDLPGDEGILRERLEEILDCANRAGDLIEKFRKVAGYLQSPYTEGLGGLVAASLEEATSGS